VYLVGLEGPAGGRHGPYDPGRADSRRELAQVRAPRDHAEHYLIVVNDLLLDVGVCVPLSGTRAGSAAVRRRGSRGPAA